MEKGSGSASKPAKKGDPDGQLSLPGGSKEAVPSRTVIPPAGADAQPAAEQEELPSKTSSSSGHLPPVPPVADPRQRTTAVPDPPAVVQEGFPIALRRIHERLKDKSELLKLHLKHYHMTTEQFRKTRTSALKLPDAIYDLYDSVVKACAVCLKSAPPPSRSRISGIRATNFGDIIFMDHCEVNVLGTNYYVLIILDGATHLVWAAPQKDLGEELTQESIRE